MEYRRLAGTDLEISRLVGGTMTFGDQTAPDVAAQMIDRCRDAGINLFDTANAYNNGESEKILGQLLEPIRDHVLIATKVGNPMGTDPDDRGLHRTAIRRAIEASLTRLRTDRVDLYYLHQPDWDTPIEETLGALSELVDEGKVRAIGVSNYAAWQIAEMRCLAERDGLPAVHISQPQYNLLSRRIEEEYAACSQRYALTDIVYNPLAGGLLTGKHQPGRAPEPGGRFAKKQYRDRYWNETQFEAVARLQAVAHQAGMSLLELAFRWLWSQPVVDAILLGASRMDQLEQNLDAAAGPELDDETMARCDDVWHTLRGAAPAYNR